MHIYIYIYENVRQTQEWSSKKCCLVPKISEDQLVKIGPGNFLVFGPAGLSEIAFMATHLSLCGKHKYFGTHKNIK